MVDFEKALNMTLDEYIVESGLDVVAKQLMKKTKRKDISTTTSTEELTKSDDDTESNNEAGTHDNNLVDLRTKIGKKPMNGEQKQVFQLPTEKFQNWHLKDSQNLKPQNENLPEIFKNNNLRNKLNNGRKWNNSFGNRRNNIRCWEAGTKKRRLQKTPFFRNNNPTSQNPGKIRGGMDLRIETLFDDIPKANFGPSVEEETIRDPFKSKTTNASSETPLQNSIVATCTNPINNFVKMESMSSMANKLLELIQGGISNNSVNVVDTKKYDLNVQKEIHAIQGKPMIYKCPGGEVISSDGPGLNVPLKPTSTGISLNQRFA